MSDSQELAVAKRPNALISFLRGAPVAIYSVCRSDEQFGIHLFFTSFFSGFAFELAGQSIAKGPNPGMFVNPLADIGTGLIGVAALEVGGAITFVAGVFAAVVVFGTVEVVRAIPSAVREITGLGRAQIQAAQQQKELPPPETHIPSLDARSATRHTIAPVSDPAVPLSLRLDLEQAVLDETGQAGVVAQLTAQAAYDASFAPREAIRKQGLIRVDLGDGVKCFDLSADGRRLRCEGEEIEPPSTDPARNIARYELNRQFIDDRDALVEALRTRANRVLQLGVGDPDQQATRPRTRAGRVLQLGAGRVDQGTKALRARAGRALR